MNNLLKKPTDTPKCKSPGRYDRFNLRDNPFPTEPVNKDSTDRRINGDIYAAEIRTKEYSLVETAFLKSPRSDCNRLRLGYICDTSYIGRGNGKSAFLVNLACRINENYCLDISNDVNKCFAVYVTPEPGGRTKSFSSFLNLIFESMLKSGIIDTCLATLRLEAASKLYPKIDLAGLAGSGIDLISKLNTESWLKDQGVDGNKLSSMIALNEHFEALPPDFPIIAGRRSLIQSFVTASTFQEYYSRIPCRGSEQHDFLLSHLIHLFTAAGFNGAFILVDDFERIPDFQSERQRKDFAIELRAALLDGPYLNARMGFYNMLLVLHAGVPQLVSNAWSSSGLGNRYPITPKLQSGHWIAFEKLTREHVSLLLKKYLTAYRSNPTSNNELLPFTPEAISVIAEINENNAAKILRTCWDLLEKAADKPDQLLIDERFVRDLAKEHLHEGPERAAPIEDPAATDLMKKAAGAQE